MVCLSFMNVINFKKSFFVLFSISAFWGLKWLLKWIFCFGFRLVSAIQMPNRKKNVLLLEIFRNRDLITSHQSYTNICIVLLALVVERIQPLDCRIKNDTSVWCVAWWSHDYILQQLESATSLTHECLSKQAQNTIFVSRHVWKQKSGYGQLWASSPEHSKRQI